MRPAEYRPGMKFRVVKEGARLRGMELVPDVHYTAYQGFRYDLRVGDVITCVGSSMTMGDGVPAVKWQDPREGGRGFDVLFDPHAGGMWGGLPPEDGYLEPVGGDEAVRLHQDRAGVKADLDSVSVRAHNRPEMQARKRQLEAELADINAKLEALT